MELQPLAQHQTHTYQAKQGPVPGQQNNNRKIELTPAQDTKTGQNPGTKLTGKFNTKGRHFSLNVQNGFSLFPSV